MCGIAGYFGVSKKLSNSIKDRLKKQMYNRGPDNFGYYESDNFILFHSRLTVIDDSIMSNQPFHRPHGRYVFAYNGELYNYKEIAKQYTFVNDYSDASIFYDLLTEQGYVKGTEHGLINGLEQTDGMFAVVYYDKQENELYLARDRFGEKPLYTYKDGKGRLYFASQINYLFTMLNDQLSINYNMIIEYLFSGYRSLFKDHSQTFFKKVQRIEPSSYYKYKLVNNKIKLKQGYYYSNKDINTNFCSFKEYPELISDNLKYIVETRLRSDTPIAFCMSGGMDSNALISIASKVYGYDIHGYTIGNDDTRYNESKVVNSVVDKLGIKHTYVDVNSGSNKGINFVTNIKNIIRNNCAPLVTISYYLHWLLLRQIAKDGYKVSMSGTGGDEIFAGYYDHFLYHIADCNSSPSAVKMAISNWEQGIGKYVRPGLFRNTNLFIKEPYYRKYLYSNSKYNKFNLLHNPQLFYEEDFGYKSMLKNRMKNELFHEVIPCILHDDDLNSMYFSVENRSPLLNHYLVNIMFSFDFIYYIQKGIGKYLLRQALDRLVPGIQQLIPIKKIGFNCSLFTILPQWKQFLFQGNSILWDIVDRNAVQNYNFYNEDDSKFLFALLNVKLFLDMFA